MEGDDEWEDHLIVSYTPPQGCEMTMTEFERWKSRTDHLEVTQELTLSSKVVRLLPAPVQAAQGGGMRHNQTAQREPGTANVHEWSLKNINEGSARCSQQRRTFLDRLNASEVSLGTEKPANFLFLSRRSGATKADERFVFTNGADAIFLRPITVGKDCLPILEKQSSMNITGAQMYFVMEQQPFVFLCTDCRTVAAHWQDPVTGQLTAVGWSRSKFNGSPGKSVEGRRIGLSKNTKEAGNQGPKKDDSLSAGMYYLDTLEKVIWFGITVPKSKNQKSKNPWRLDGTQSFEKVVTSGFSSRRTNGNLS